MKSLPWLLAAAALMATAGNAASRQVVVYSFLTDVGRNFMPTTSDRPLRCRLGNGGYHDWGAIRAGEKPVKLDQIEPWIHAAWVNSFRLCAPTRWLTWWWYSTGDACARTRVQVSVDLMSL